MAPPSSLGQPSPLRLASRALKAGCDLHALCHFERALQDAPPLSKFILPEMERLSRNIVAGAIAQPSLFGNNSHPSLNVLFVLHNRIDSNSGYHVQLHAKKLAEQGMDCLYIGPREAERQTKPEKEGLRYLSEVEGADADLSKHFSNGRGPDIIFAWTPRETVRRIVETIQKNHPCPLLIHLEDNEEYLTESALGKPFAELRSLGIQELDRIIPQHLYHPIRGARFLAEASGLTSCVSELDALNPGALANLVIGAPVDRNLFYPRPRNEKLRQQLGLSGNDVVLAYTGNTHHANLEEIEELYSAIDLLRQAGIPAHLIRTGENAVTSPKIAKAEPWLHNMGWIARDEMPDLLAAADILVQPGAPGEMNDKRLPSKLPEYFAMGLPVILPATNVGKNQLQTETRWILQNADSKGIAQAVMDILESPRQPAPASMVDDTLRNTLAVYVAGIAHHRNLPAPAVHPTQPSTFSGENIEADQRLLALKDRHAGERCVLVANGPSLNDMDLGFLAGETTIGMNKIFLGLDRFGFHPKYFVAVNRKVVAQAANEISAMPCVKFISRAAAAGNTLEDAFTHLITTHPYRLDAKGEPQPYFSQDMARDGVNEGWTVTHVALQLAYHLGFAEVVIIGMDHRFSFSGAPNEAQILEGDDPNHFSPGYFGGGQSWDTPDLAKSEAAYKTARKAYEAAGRRIIDATVNGACTVFEKGDYQAIFA